MNSWNRMGAAALTLLILVSMAAPLLAADEEEPVVIGQWNKEVRLGLNILQSSYSNNWNGGNKGSIVWAGNLDALYENQLSDRTNWRNTLKLVYGQTHQQQRIGNELFWQKPDKTDDIIDFESLFRMTPQSGWDPFVAFNFTSMFEDLTDPEGRAINFNPMTFKESAGISRSFFETEDRLFMTRLGIAFIQSSRQFYLNPSPDESLQREGANSVAAESVTQYKSPVLDGRVVWDSKLILSLPITYSGKSTFEDAAYTVVSALPDDLASYTTALDVDWENSFTSNITKAISVTLYLRWAYDKYDNSVKPVIGDDGSLANEASVHNAIRKAGQFQQTLALGFGHTFN